MSNIVPIPQRPQINRIKALNELAAEADLLAMRSDEIGTLVRIVGEKIRTMTNREQIAKVTAAAKQTATLRQDEEATLQRCNAVLVQLDGDENYEGNDPECDLRRNVVSGRLAILIGAFPNSGSVRDPEIYTRQMLENVCKLEGLTLVALDAGCNEFVATHKFLPTVKELLDVLKKQTELWQRRIWAITGLADQSRRTVARIEALEQG